MRYVELVKTIDTASRQLLGRASSVVNQMLVIRNWLIGAHLVEFQQHGKDRAKYGARLLESLAVDLAGRGLKGLEIRNLRDCRLLYLHYPQIRQTVSAEFSNTSDALAIHKAVGRKLPTPISARLVLKFSWSQLQELMRLDDPWKRAFYENECLQGNWSVRQLQRQIGSLLYERTGFSTNKRVVLSRAQRQEPQQGIQDLIRDPYVLEFTGLADLPEYHESDLENALLNHLQAFLLELGAGFCFEARQRRITVANKHDYIDLVFYQRRLRCHVLLDLKVRSFRHTDAGQMNFYLNWWKANALEPGDNPPVGILVCSDRDHTEVEFATAGMDNRMFVSRYLTALPTAERLQRFLEADRARIEALTDGTPFKPTPTTKKRAARPTGRK